MFLREPFYAEGSETRNNLFAFLNAIHSIALNSLSSLLPFEYVIIAWSLFFFVKDLNFFYCNGSIHLTHLGLVEDRTGCRVHGFRLD